MITSLPPGAERSKSRENNRTLSGMCMKASRLQMMSKGSVEFLLEDVSQDELDRVVHSELFCALVGDCDHFFREVDADHLGAIGLREVKRGAADATADVEDANPRPE